jgi:hypothetical protein
MCLITEHARAKIMIKELEAKVAELQKQTTPPLPPVVRGEISYPEIFALLSEKFPGVQLLISDFTQYLCDIEDINTFLAQDETNRIQYTGELGFDCDDFAYRLQGQFSNPDWAKIAIGIIWTDLHALNICIDANRDVWLIEPQSDKALSNLEPWQGNNARFIIM